MQQETTFRENDNQSILFESNPKSCSVFKPWLDDEDPMNVLFQSVHLHGRNFYPGTGSKMDKYDENNALYYPAGIYNYPIAPGSATS